MGTWCARSWRKEKDSTFCIRSELFMAGLVIEMDFAPAIGLRMPRRAISQKKMKALCAELGPEDGVDPRDALRLAARKKGGRKTLQLCGQVAEAIHFALGASNDDVLREMGVAAVQPAPDQSRLLVSIAPMLPGLTDPDKVLVHLQGAQGKLRAEVAAAIHRRKVPELTYCVVAGPEKVERT
jgi:ribosome-binding factor A